MKGFTVYTIKSGDTLFNIANSFSSKICRILYANPRLEVTKILYPGQRIVVPFGEIVQTNVLYSYNIMQNNLNSLKIVYPFLEINSIGKSFLGNEIPVVKIGSGNKEVFYSASFHANEWITSVLLMKFIENFCISYVTNSDIYGYSSKNIFNTCSIYLVPMVNPDGVNLVTGNIPKDSVNYKNVKQIAYKYPNVSFPDGWKANIQGVDLNLQFPARLETSS